MSTRSIVTAAPAVPAIRRLNRGHPLGVIRSRQYRRYWLAGFATFTGFNMQMLTRGWLMEDMTNSPFLVAMVSAAMMLPMLLLSLIGGVLADRLDRKRITIAADASMLVSFAALFVLAATGVLRPWHIIAISACNGIAFALAVSARQALIASLVHRQQLRTAAGLSSTTYNASQIIGPAIAGAMIPTLGINWALGVSTLTVLPALLLYTSLRPSARTSVDVERQSVMSNLKTGITYAASDRTLRFLLLSALVIVLTVGPFQSLMPVFAADVLNVGAGGLGVLTLSAGIGSLIGSLAVVSIGGRVKHETLELVTGVSAAVALTGFALSPWFPLSVAMAGLTAFSMTSFMVSNMTVVQVVAPDRIRGRVMSVRFLVVGLMPVGSLTVGALAETYEAPQSMAGVAAVGIVLFGLVQLTGRAASRRAEAMKLGDAGRH